MARSLKKITSTATPKKKVVRKRALSVATLKLGGEPALDGHPSKAELVRALNWYTACSDDSEAHKAWVAEFMRREGFEDSEIAVISSKIKRIIPTYIFIARMFNNGVQLDSKYRIQANDYFRGYLARRAAEQEELDDEGNPVPTANKPVAKKAANAAAAPLELVNYIESLIEDIVFGRSTGAPKSIFSDLQKMGCTAANANALKKAFQFQTQEFLALANGDPELVEAYPDVHVFRRRALAAFVELLNNDLDSFVRVTKAARKPRKKKPVKVEKLVARVKYKKQDDTYKIASLDPTKIIGANVLWTFNTKYRILAYYEAGEGGLGIKGTTVTNFKKSGQKKLRKPEQQLLQFTTGAVKALARNFSEITTTEAEAVGRLNADIVILRVF